MICRIAPTDLRKRAADALASASLGECWVWPIVEGTYDVDHLQRLYTLVQPRAHRDASCAAAEGWVVALGVWSGLAPCFDGLYWKLVPTAEAP